MPLAVLFEANQYFRIFFIKKTSMAFNAEINTMSSCHIGVKYQIICCREAGVLSSECQARPELLPANGGKVVAHGQTSSSCLCWRKTTACSRGGIGQKLLCKWKSEVLEFSMGIAQVVKNGHRLLI